MKFISSWSALMILWLCLDTHQGAAATVAVPSPAEIAGGATINFDGLPDYSVANLLFAAQGATFTRDDGRSIYLFDWTALGRTTTSPRNVLATVLQSGVDPPGSWATHLNVIPSVPLFALGAYFGNDHADLDFQFTRVSAYGDSGQLLGFVQVEANHNLSVDQFIGIRSDVPIYQVRFENFGSTASPSVFYSVVIDDLVFTPVPEPAAVWVMGAALLPLWLASRRSKRGTDTPSARPESQRMV